MDSVLVSLLLNLNIFSITLGALILYLYTNNFEHALSYCYKELGSSVQTNSSAPNYTRFLSFLASVLYICSVYMFVCIQAKAKLR